MSISQYITGIVMIFLGMVLSALVIFYRHLVWLLIYAIPLIIIGIVILLNKKEDKIEEIKSRRKNG